jgi:replicative DNA helicase
MTDYELQRLLDGPETPQPEFRNSRRAPAPQIDACKLNRLPPHSIEAEQGVIGCCLLDPKATVGELQSRIKNVSQVFYHLPHATIFEQLSEMLERSEEIDLITLQQRLRDKKQLDSVGGLTYLASLQDAVPSAANLNYYFDIVWEKFLLRRTIRIAQETISEAYEVETEVEKFLDETERKVMESLAIRNEVNTSDNIIQIVRRSLDNIEALYESGQSGKMLGIPTGFHDLDRMTLGLMGSDMIVLAARPSIGKTSFAMNIVEHVAINEKIPVGVFSLEMSATSLVTRMICSRARVNIRSLRERGLLSERDFTRITEAATAISKSPIFIDETSGLSIMQLRSKARRMVQNNGIRLFVIDYMQLLHSNNRRCENRQQEVADISGGIKGLAKELNVPVIVIAQLNRDLDRREGGKPRLSDLRESGAIEQDADLVGILYRTDDPDTEPSNEAEAAAISVNLLIAKQRNGPVGEIPLTFLKNYTRYESATPPDAMI